MKRHVTLPRLAMNGLHLRGAAIAGWPASLLTILFLAASAAHACEFPIVKEQIDIVLDKDARLGAEFRAQVKDGSDSIAVIESLVSAEMREKVDVCRFYVAEYLTKRGFPPAEPSRDFGTRKRSVYSRSRHTRGTGVRAIIVALIAGAAGVLSVQAASGLDEKQVEAGEAVYNDYCQTCHGANLVNSGQTFDLRKLRKDERARFENSVTNGKNQMPPWKGVLDSQQIDAIWAYIRANANDR